LLPKKAAKKEIAIIQESLDKMKNAITDIPKIMEIDREFHINIARAAHNNLLYSMVFYLNDLLKENLWTNMKEKSWSIPGCPQKYLEEHIAIFNAIKNKDSKDARKRMYDHLAGVEKDLLSEADRFVKSKKWVVGGEWVAWKFMGIDLHDKTLGVIGAGRIGSDMLTQVSK